MDGEVREGVVVSDGIERRLAAILSADVVGYSRLMAEDERATIHTLTAYRTEVSSLVSEHRGRVVDSPGDNLLAEFPTALDAVECAIEIQKVIGVRNESLPEHRRMDFRIGVHLGDVSVQDGRLYGDGVNIAARLEGLAEPRGITVSGAVQEQVRSKVDVGFDDLGEREVKNIPEPVHVYRVAGERPSSSAARRVGPRRAGRARLAALWLAGLMVLAAVVSLAIRELGPDDEIGATVEALDAPGQPTVAVLPFIEVSGDPAQRYFAVGITNELTNALATQRNLFLTSPAAGAEFAGREVSPRDAAEALGVRYVVQGTTQRSQDRVRITARLTDTQTDVAIWTDAYERDLRDVFAIQADIVVSLLDALRVRVLEAELRRVRAAPTESLDAHDRFLRGFAHFQAFTPTDHARARELFTRAHELDPQYAQPLGFLAALDHIAFDYGWSLDPGLRERARARNDAAFGLDPFAPVVLVNRVMLAAPEDRLPLAQDMIAKAPNHAGPLLVYAAVLVEHGRFAQAQRLIERARRQSPRAPSTAQIIEAQLLLASGESAAAVRVLEQIRRRGSGAVGPLALLVDQYAHAGRLAEAQAVSAEILEIHPGHTVESVVRLLRAGAGLPPDIAQRLPSSLRVAGIPE